MIPKDPLSSPSQPTPKTPPESDKQKTGKKAKGNRLPRPTGGVPQHSSKERAYTSSSSSSDTTSNKGFYNRRKFSRIVDTFQKTKGNKTGASKKKATESVFFSKIYTPSIKSNTTQKTADSEVKHRSINVLNENQPTLAKDILSDSQVIQSLSKPILNQTAGLQEKQEIHTPLVPSKNSYCMDAGLLGHILGDSFLEATSLEGNSFSENLQYLLPLLQNERAIQEIVGSNIDKLFVPLKECQEFAQKLGWVTILPSDQNMFSSHFVTACGQIDSLVQGLIRNISILEKGKQIIIPGGWQNPHGGHAMLYVIEKDSEDSYSFSVLNTGDGIRYHESAIEGLKQKIDPVYKISHISKELITCSDIYRALLEKAIPCLENGAKSYHQATDIYDKILPAFQGTVENFVSKSDDFITAQRSGTCSWQAVVAVLCKYLEKPVYKRLMLEIKTQALIDFCHKALPTSDPDTLSLIQLSSEALARYALKNSKNGYTTDDKLQQTLDIIKAINSRRGKLSSNVNEINLKKPVQGKKQTVSIFSVGSTGSPSRITKLQPAEPVIHSISSIVPKKISPENFVSLIEKARRDMQVLERGKDWSGLSYYIQDLMRSIILKTSEDVFWKKLGTIESTKNLLLAMEMFDSISRSYLKAIIGQPQDLRGSPEERAAFIQILVLSQKIATAIPLEDSLLYCQVRLENDKSTELPPIRSLAISIPQIYSYGNDDFLFNWLPSQQSTNADEIATKALGQYSSMGSKQEVISINKFSRDHQDLISLEFDDEKKLVLHRWDSSPTHYLSWLLQNQEIQEKIQQRWPKLKNATEKQQIGRLLCDFEGQVLPKSYSILFGLTERYRYYLQENTFTDVNLDDPNFGTCTIKHIDTGVRSSLFEVSLKGIGPLIGFKAQKKNETWVTQTSKSSMAQILHGQIKYHEAEYQCSPGAMIYVNTKWGNFANRIAVLSKPIGDMSKEEVMALSYVDANETVMIPQLLAHITEHGDKLSSQEYQLFICCHLFGGQSLEKAIASSPSLRELWKTFIYEQYTKASKSFKIDCAAFCLHLMNFTLGFYDLEIRHFCMDKLHKMMKETPTLNQQDRVHKEQLAGYFIASFVDLESEFSDDQVDEIASAYLTLQAFGNIQNFIVPVQEQIRKVVRRASSRLVKLPQERLNSLCHNFAKEYFSHESDTLTWTMQSHGVYSCKDKDAIIDIFNGNISIAGALCGELPVAIRQNQDFLRVFQQKHLSVRITAPNVYTCTSYNKKTKHNEVYVISRNAENSLSIKKHENDEVFDLLSYQELEKYGLHKALLSPNLHWRSKSKVYIEDPTGVKIAQIIPGAGVTKIGEIQRIHPGHSDHGAVLRDFNNTAVQQRFAAIDPKVLLWGDKTITLGSFNQQFTIRTTDKGKEILWNQETEYLVDNQQVRLKALPNLNEYILLSHSKNKNKKVLIPKQPINIRSFKTGALGKEFSLLPVDNQGSLAAFDVAEDGSLIGKSVEENLFLAYLHIAQKDYEKAFSYLDQKKINPLQGYSTTEQQYITWIKDYLQKSSDSSPQAQVIQLLLDAQVVRNGFQGIQRKKLLEKYSLRDLAERLTNYYSTFIPNSKISLTQDQEMDLLLNAPQSEILQIRLQHLQQGASKTIQDVKRSVLPQKHDDTRFHSEFITVNGRELILQQYIIKQSAHSVANSDFLLAQFDSLQNMILTKEPAELHSFKARLMLLDIFPARSNDVKSQLIQCVFKQLRFLIDVPILLKKDLIEEYRALVPIINAICSQQKNIELFSQLPLRLKMIENLCRDIKIEFESIKGHQVHAEIFPLNKRSTPTINATQSQPTTEEPIFVGTDFTMSAVTPSQVALTSFTNLLKDHKVEFDVKDVVDARYEKDTLQQVLTPNHSSKTVNRELQRLQDDVTFARKELSKRFVYQTSLSASEVKKNIQPLMKKLRSEADSLKTNILAIANRKSESISNRLQYEAALIGKLTKPISIEDVFVACLQKNSHILTSKNPALTQKDITQIVSLTQDHLLQLTRLQRLQRSDALLQQAEKVTDATEKNELMQQAYHELAAPEIIDVKELDLLVFSYYANIRLWPSQIEILKLMDVDNQRNLITQLIMGSGKSKVLLPLLALRGSTGKNIPTIIVPESLFETNSADLRTYSADFLYQEVEAFYVKQDEHLSIEDLQVLSQKLKRVKQNKSYIVTTPWSIYSLKQELSVIRSVLANNPNDKAACAKEKLLDEVLSTFEKEADAIFDEADMITDITKEVNVSVGKPEKLSDAAQDLAVEICSIIIHDKELNSIFELSSDKESHFTEAQYHRDLKSKIGDKLLAWIKKKHPEFAFGTEERKEFIQYLLKDPKISTIPESAQHCSDELKNLFGDIRMVLNDLLPNTLNRNPNQHYGLSHETITTYCIPYERSNKPSEGSECGYHYETMLYTLFYYSKVGVSVEQMQRLIQELRHQIQTEAELNDIDITKTQAYKKFEELGFSKHTNIFTISAKEIKELTQTYNSSFEKRMKFAKNFAFREITYYPQKFSSNFYTLIDIFHSVKGFTGTLWNQDTFPTKLEAAPVLGVDGKTLAILSQKNPKVTVIPQQFATDDIDPLFKNLDGYNALIDAGAWFRGISNTKVAKKLQKHFTKTDSSIDAIVYVNDVDIPQGTLGAFVVLEKGNKEPIRVDESKVPFEKRFTYYHLSTGLDMKQHAKAKALVTTDQNMILRDLLQAVWRMRQLNKEQYTDFAIRPELLDMIAKADFDHILRYVVVNQGKRQEQDISRSVFKQFRHIVKSTIEKSYTLPGLSLERKREIQNILQPKLMESLEENAWKQFGQIESSDTSTKVIENFIGHLIDNELYPLWESVPELDQVMTLPAMEKKLHESVSREILPDTMQVQAVTIGSTQQVKTQQKTSTQAQVQLKMNAMEVTEKFVSFIDRTCAWGLYAGKFNLFSHGFYEEHDKLHIPGPICTINQYLQTHEEELEKGPDLTTFFSPHIRLTKNFRDICTLDRRVGKELAQIFGLGFKPLSSCLMRQDIKTGSLEFLILAPDEAGAMWNLLEFDREYDSDDAIQAVHDGNEHNRHPLNLTNETFAVLFNKDGRECRLALVHPTIGICQEGKDTIDKAELEKNPQYIAFITESKFFDGKLTYTKPEMAYLKSWMQRVGPKNMEVMLVQNILRNRPDQQRAYYTSPLHRLIEEEKKKLE